MKKNNNIWRGDAKIKGRKLWDLKSQEAPSGCRAGSNPAPAAIILCDYNGR